MPNKYYCEYNAPPKEATKMPPPPGTKGQPHPGVTFVPQTDEPKKGL
jgi:hypothetical protein